LNPFAEGQATEYLDHAIHQGGKGLQDSELKLKEEIEATIQNGLKGTKL